MHLLTTPVFTKNYHSDKFITINRGGTRSSKTRSIAQIMVMWLLSGVYSAARAPIYKGTWSTVRKYSTTLDSTVIRDFEEELQLQNVYGLIKHDKTRKVYSYQGRVVEFMGADDEQKLRGSKREILYCNEANELNFKKEFFQLLIRTGQKVFLDFNPDNDQVWINTELEQKRMFDIQDVDVIVSSYRDNTFLPARQIAEIEYLEKTDPEFWKIYGLGEYGKIRGAIYENWAICDKVPEGAKLLGLGLDFGFTHPSALLEVYLQGGELWVNEVIHQAGLTNQQICERMREVGIKREEIFADSAEPKSIQEIYVQGFNIKEASKGPDSIRNGIDILKRYKINVTAKSEETIKEFKSYKWAVDKNGIPLNAPVDAFNHAMDALRYLALAKLAKSYSGTYAIR